MSAYFVIILNSKIVLSSLTSTVTNVSQVEDVNVVNVVDLCNRLGFRHLPPLHCLLTHSLGLHPLIIS